MMKVRSIGGYVLLLSVLPAVTLPHFVANAFIAPRLPEVDRGADGEGGPGLPHKEAPRDAPLTEASPLVCLGFRPGQLDEIAEGSRLRSVWTLTVGVARIPGLHARCDGPVRTPFEWLNAQACVGVASLEVDAPPIQPNAPPIKA